MIRYALAISLLATTVACGSVQIRTEEGAKIYVNGRLVGKGHGTIRKRGGPSTARITVKTEDGRRASRRIKRSFDGWTALSCPFTYLIGCFANWSYPDSVYLDLPERAPYSPGTKGKVNPGWGERGNDVWNQPPPGWKSTPSSAPAPAEEKAPSGFDAPPGDQPTTDPQPPASEDPPPAPPPAETPPPASPPPPAGDSPWDKPPPS
jgi:hypothetical protein